MKSAAANTVLMSLFLMLFSSLAFGQDRVGIEFEYQGQGRAANFNDTSNHVALLESVKKYFGAKTEISVHPWNKYDNAEGTFYAAFEDRQGRQWMVVPEIMNGNKFNGYELVTPPLSWTTDGKPLRLLLKDIREKGEFVPGESSSSHFNFDISHLLQDPTDVSKLVDLILFIENNTVEMYRAIMPRRYGAHINRFAVPLSLDHPRLLKELVALPPEHRTFESVRRIFLRYEYTEIGLYGGNLVHAWKHRAVNYGKLFQLGSFKYARFPALEFRISDLRDDRDIEKAINVFSRIIKKGPETPIRQFRDAFAAVTTLRNSYLYGQVSNRKEKMAQADLLIENLPEQDYLNFLEALGLDKELSQKPRGIRSVRTCEGAFALGA